MRSLQLAFQYIRRTPYQALAAIIVMVLTFLVATIVIVVSLASTTLLKYFESRPQITAYFEDSKVQEDIDGLIQRLEANSFVSSVKFISKDEALEIYKEQNKNDPILLEMVTADILPASIEVAAIDAKNLTDIADILTSEAGVEDVVYQKDLVENLISWTNAIRLIGIVLLIFLSLESLLVLLTITGMKIAMRREEIEILKLIGASPWYIQGPFLFEGVIYGVIGGFISWVISYILILYISPFLTTLLSGLPIQVPPSILFMLLLLAISMLAGIILGMLGSIMSVKRYLK